MLEPLNGSSLDTLILKLRWEVSDGVPSRLEISTLPSVADAEQTYEQRLSGRTANEYMPKSNLQPSTLYYWKVTAICGDWPKSDSPGAASTGSFRTGRLSHSLPAPVPLMPLEGAHFPRKVAYRWSSVTGATGYLISTGQYGFFAPHAANGLDTHYYMIVESQSRRFEWSRSSSFPRHGLISKRATVTHVRGLLCNPGPRSVPDVASTAKPPRGGESTRVNPFIGQALTATTLFGLVSMVVGAYRTNRYAPPLERNRWVPALVVFLAWFC